MEKILQSLFLLVVLVNAKPTNINGQPKTEVSEVFCVDNVELYSISADKHLTAAGTSRLKAWNLQDGKILLHMDKMLSYPLVPNVTPVVHSEDGYITLPDLETKGAAVGLKLPAGLDNAFIEVVLGGERKFGADATKVISNADTFADGLVKQAEYMKQFIEKHTASYRIGDPAQPGSHTTLLSNAKRAKAVSGAVVTATGWAANIMDKATTKVGEIVAPHVQKGVSNLVRVFITQKKDSQKDPDEMTAAGIKAIQKLATAAGKSATIVTNSFKENTVQVVQHNYGADMGGAMEDAFDSAKNTATALGHVRSFAPDAIIKNTAGHIIKTEPKLTGPTHSQYRCEL